jgi:hypothetical protein
MELASSTYDIKERWADEYANYPIFAGVDPLTGRYIYEGDSSWLLCQMEDKPSPNDVDIPF